MSLRSGQVGVDNTEYEDGLPRSNVYKLRMMMN